MSRFKATVVVYERGGKHYVKVRDGNVLDVGDMPVGKKLEVDTPLPYTVTIHLEQPWLLRNDSVALKFQLTEMKNRIKAIGQVDEVVVKRTHDGLVTKSSEMETSISHIASAAYTKRLADLLNGKVKSLTPPTVGGLGLTLIAPIKSWNKDEIVFAGVDYKKAA